MAYRGRFAPSPTGPLHAGSLVAALASWLDARAHGGAWLVRIEDIDTPRCVPGADEAILTQLARCGLLPDESPVWQSRRSALYESALCRLVAAGQAYPCACTRSDIARLLAASGRPHGRHEEWIYPGTCRPEHGGLGDRPGRAVRLKVPVGPPVEWVDRRIGPQSQDVAREVGDFVLHRADGVWAYQLAVVVDDAAQGITDVVRGEDLVGNTARQIVLQRLLAVPTPAYLHTPLVRGADGEKLSKQSGAQALDLSRPIEALESAGAFLGIAAPAHDLAGWLAGAVAQWRGRWCAGSGMMPGLALPQEPRT